MNTSKILEGLSHIANYIISLDWPYIITFIIITYGILHFREKNEAQAKEDFKIRTRYLVALVGIVYGIAIYFIRNYTLPQVERLFQSFVFALVFHKLLIDQFISYILRKLFPPKINPTSQPSKKIKKLKDRNGQL